MNQQKYPVGIQTFSKIIKQGYTYVDKTQYIKPLISQGQYIFLSRPRRFGKSLLLSTLEAYFEGHRELFKGLAADSMDLDWTPSPVLHFDLNTGKYDDPMGLENRLRLHLENLERKYNISPRFEDDMALRFESLIRSIFETTGQEVVILIDEYDKPLLDIEENRTLFEQNQRILKSFFGNLKSMDSYIRFAFITGVARFNKVSIFSDLNNLDDISLEDSFADICGWNEKELIDNFSPGIQALADKRKEDFATTLNELRDYYDGYLFTEEGSRQYNPFSILKALKKMRIDPYWFDSGTPTFLARRIKNLRIFPPAINGQTCSRDELISIGLNDRNPIPLMFQTGYLTIGKLLEENFYELRFPNREVEKGFYQELLPLYVPEVSDPFSQFYFYKFQKSLIEGHPEDFMKRIATLLKNLPYDDNNESTYRAVTFLLVVLSGTPAIAEWHSYKGRSDLEVFAGGNVYIFEFKYNKSVEEAIEQIHSRDYIGKYELDSRKIYLIAANYVSKEENRGLEYEIESLRL
ncbi:MAG: ATP-binding protein [Muribaculaceae bacterium]|nr:ATP-binding protein [Muribaculaceae bacterium]